MTVSYSTSETISTVASGGPAIEQNSSENSNSECRSSHKNAWHSVNSALPAIRTVTAIDLDLTEACNLACIYCFKWQKKAVHMDEALAKAALDWLLASSGNFQGELKVNLMGGEPLLRFELIQKIVPYGKSRARQLGKSLHFGCTTNCSMLTDDIMSFWRRFGMGFHCSIDGIPEVQNANRPLLSGGPSASQVEKNVPKILAYRPEVMARATVTPVSVRCLFESAKYFEWLGFRSMTFRMATNCEWKPADFEALRSEYQRVGELYLDRIASTRPLFIEEFVNALRVLHSTEMPSRHPCGAGRGVALIDPRGDIWPCHRFGPHLCGGQFRLGKIGEPFNNRLRDVFLKYCSFEDGQAECRGCRAVAACRVWCYVECIDSTGTLYKPSSKYCEFVRIVYDQVLLVDDYLRNHHPEILSNLVKGNH